MTLRGAVGAVASEGFMADAATQTLTRGGSAVDACIAAWFAASARLAGVLLGPVHLVVAGPGAGAHTYDGSVLQPGREAPRPRGFFEADEIPHAALVAVPAALAAITAAHAHHGVQSLAELARARGTSAADARGRLDLLGRIGDVGSVALRESGFTRAMLDVAGRPVGGNLTSADLHAIAAGLDRGSTTGSVLRVRDEACEPSSVLRPLIACACDVRGVLTVLHCAHDPEGVPVPDLQLIAPRLAVPVRRGVPRITPGHPVSVPAPIAILLEGEVPWAAVGVESASEPETFDPILNAQASGLSFEQGLAHVMREAGAVVGLAVLRSAGARAGVRAVRVI